MKRLFNKSFVTNLLAVAVVVAGYFSPWYGDVLKSVGFFALSGAVTNWLAVHMLFEKVPLLYGSGVIPNRFEEFKSTIKLMMMEQFFSQRNIEQFIETEEKKGARVLNLKPILAVVDYERIFEGLVTAIMDSSFGAMLQMVGGEEALKPLQQPITEKLQTLIQEMAESDQFKAALQQGLDAHKIGEDLVGKIEVVIENRLQELTPKMVKQIVQDIIQQHLGWLVVWGGIFGGLIGFAVYFV